MVCSMIKIRNGPLTKEAKVRASIDRLIEGLQEIITDEEDYGYYQKNIYSRGEWRSGGLEGTLQALPLMKYFEITFYLQPWRH